MMTGSSFADRPDREVLAHDQLMSVIDNGEQLLSKAGRANDRNRERAFAI
jgi:hypothetical protein